MTTTATKLVPGDQIHWIGRTAMTAHTSLTGLGGGVLLQRGMTVTLSQAFIEANDAWLKLDEEGQKARWNGELRWALGPWPEGKLATLPGDRDHEEARETARLAAWRIEDAGERRVALAEVERVYGRQPTSRETARYNGGSR